MNITKKIDYFSPLTIDLYLLFFICRTDWLDGKHVVFGHVISGADVVRKMEKCGSKTGSTLQKVSISACGELK